MSKKIFISYRRSDSDIVGRISDRILAHFGEDSVFMDVDNVPVGEDFRAVLEKAIADSACVIAAVGNGWISAHRKADEAEKTQDYVHFELSLALAQEVPIIPVLLSGESMPEARKMPQDIRSLAFITATPVRSGRDFHDDIARLITALGKVGAFPADAHSPRQEPPSGKTLPAGVSVHFDSSQLLDLPHTLKGEKVGRYSLLEFITSGGGGAVFRARDANLGSEVCLKIAYPVKQTLSNLQHLVEKGVRGVAEINHPGIVSVRDFDSFLLADDNKSFFVCMDLEEGETMDKWLGALAAEERFRRGLLCIRDIAAILCDAHEFSYSGDGGVETIGVLHGDIKPGNILVVAGRPKLLDFMLVDVQKLQIPDVAERLQSITDATMAFGTPNFMAPEQAREGVITRKTDIFSFGKMIVYLYDTRVLATNGASDGEGKLGQALLALAQSCCAQDPGSRPSTMRDVLDELDAMVGTLSDQSPAAESGGGAIPTGSANRRSWLARLKNLYR